jgi:glutaredoxin
VTTVELYGKSDCHLCDVAKETILRIRETHPFDFSVVLLDEHHERYEEFKERVPVVFIDSRFAFQYRVPEKAFIRKLEESDAPNAVPGR